VSVVRWDCLGLKETYEARLRVEGKVFKTPILEDEILGKSVGAKRVHHKLECIQPTGSFKIRGATNKIMALTQDERNIGVITFSTGNHGRALAHAAGKEKMKSYVCMSKRVSKDRIKNVEMLGAKAIVHGDSQDDTEEHYRKLIDEFGYIPVPPFDDPHIISGQGTIALEFLESIPELDLLLVPLSGGGLLSGIALTAKLINPRIKIVGVSIEKSPVMLESIRHGKPLKLKEQDSIADSLLGGIGKENRYTMNLVMKYVDEHIVVSEDEIHRGMKHLFNKHNIIIEGAAAAGISGIITEKVDVRGKSVGTILTGRTVMTDKYLSLMNQTDYQKEGE